METPIRTLKDYRPQHDEKCEIHKCRECGHWRGDPTMHGYGDVCDEWHSLPCSCGLDALLAAQALTFEYFSAVNRERCESPNGFNHALPSWSLSDWFLAVLGELGESANVGKKLNRVRDGIPGNKESPEALRAKLRKDVGESRRLARRHARDW